MGKIVGEVVNDDCDTIKDKDDIFEEVGLKEKIIDDKDGISEVVGWYDEDDVWISFVVADDAENVYLYLLLKCFNENKKLVKKDVSYLMNVVG